MGLASRCHFVGAAALIWPQIHAALSLELAKVPFISFSTYAL